MACWSRSERLWKLRPASGEEDVIPALAAGRDLNEARVEIGMLVGRSAAGRFFNT